MINPTPLIHTILQPMLAAAENSMLVNPSQLVSAVVYSFLGIAVFAIGFYLLDKATPHDLWKEIIEKQNKALAIVVGAVSLGICLIIASAIHG